MLDRFAGTQWGVLAMLQVDCGTGEERNWIVSETSFHSETLGKCESVMALGNGYLGVRSSLEEYYPRQTRNLFVAGTFNKCDANEPTELPNAADVVEMQIMLNGVRFSLDKGKIHAYRRDLRLKTGELVRNVLWESPAGERYRLRFRRFVSLDDLHLMGSKVDITPLDGTCTVELQSGINGQMTNSGTQHFREGEKRIYDREVLELIQTTTETGIHFVFHTAHLIKVNGGADRTEPSMAIGRRRVDMRYSWSVPKDATVTIEKLSSVHTSRDPAYADGSGALDQVRRDALAAFQRQYRKGYDALFQASAARWQEYWDRVDIEVTAENRFDQVAIRFAQYHLLIMTPRHDSRLGIGAKGLTGEGYKGHSFWDTEIFIVPYFLYTQPQVARGLLEYRYHTLEGARKKARDNGYRGAMYPWESAVSGEEETPVWGAVNILTGRSTKIWSGFLEQHITADVAYAVWHYYQVTQDHAFMDQFGSEILFETATFWTSRLEWDEQRQAYVLTNVIGPDEYKEHVDNNAFTNYMAHWNISTAIAHYRECEKKNPDLLQRLADRCDLARSFAQWVNVVEHIYLPRAREQDHVIPQDDSYLSKPVVDISRYRNAAGAQTILQEYSRDQVNQLQVSKQADVVMLMYLLPEAFSLEEKRANLSYYEPKTIHDSSLSMAVHSILASQLGVTDIAYVFFERAARIDLGPNMRSSDAGIHAASLAGIWKAAVLGFGGVGFREGTLSIQPRLPTQWVRMKFPLDWRGIRLEITVDHEQIAVEQRGAPAAPLEVEIEGVRYPVGERLVLNRKTAAAEGKRRQAP